MNKTLSQLQRDFQGYILYGETGFLERIVDDQAGGERPSVQGRGAIYADAYRLRLIDALDANYSALHTLLGDGQFTTLAKRYIKAFPSQHPSIRWFGDHLADLLSAEAPYCEEPILAELARFEWALSLAFDSADTAIQDMEAVRSLSPEQWAAMTLCCHPSLCRLDLTWNTVAIWEACQRDEEPPVATRSEWPRAWLIWRQNLTTRFRSLEVEEAWALDQALAGNCFADICAGLCEWVDAVNVAGRMASMLKRWLVDGLIIDPESVGSRA